MKKITDYKVTRQLGTYRVRYNCPGCKIALSNKLDDSGAIDTCPECGETYHVPGLPEKAEVDRQQQELAAEKERKRKEKAEKKEAERATTTARLEKLRPERLPDPNPKPKASAGDARNRSDIGYFLNPVELYRESNAWRYHNKRFPALSLLVRAGSSATLSIFFFFTFAICALGIALFVAMILALNQGDSLSIAQFGAQMLGLIFLYIINCWFAVVRLALADFVRTQLSIEENIRKYKGE
ncbi:hypothetical protein SV7mr_25880 [Stieleria bergensis]|uniref:Uncharacterized protein n=1 Tax=Stieleria bergensis TaxID=2528025 RepID=A0A517SVD1_9BACT|nr:hypothetical protein SV7mr_25880 [Planctomycetes bacterium SV_7m_r]